MTDYDVEKMQADTMEVKLETVTDNPSYTGGIFIKCPACEKIILWQMVERQGGLMNYCCKLLIMSEWWGNLPPGVELDNPYSYFISKCQLDIIQERLTRPDNADLG